MIKHRYLEGVGAETAPVFLSALQVQAPQQPLGTGGRGGTSPRPELCFGAEKSLSHKTQGCRVVSWASWQGAVCLYHGCVCWVKLPPSQPAHHLLLSPGLGQKTQHCPVATDTGLCSTPRLSSETGASGEAQVHLAQPALWAPQLLLAYNQRQGAHSL